MKNQFGMGCCCNGGGGSPPCSHVRACISFYPICPDAVTGISVSMTFTPDGGGAPVTVTGTSLTLCLSHTGAGTISWSFSSDNYFAASGSYHVTECGNGGDPVVNVYPKTYKVCVSGCNIATDGTSVTVTLSGSASGSCTPTPVTTASGGKILCCTFTLAAPMTTPPTITVTADRYKANPGNPVPGLCSASINMQPADGYFCCDPTNPAGTCKPIKNTCTLSTPVGAFAIDFGGTSGVPTVTATVQGISYRTSGYTNECLCDFGVSTPTAVTVTFFLTQFQCFTNGGFGGVIQYQSCPHSPASLDCPNPHSGTDWVAYDDAANVCAGGGSAYYEFSLSGSCPPGQLGTFSSEGCHNRYLSGGYTLTEV